MKKEELSQIIQMQKSLLDQCQAYQVVLTNDPNAMSILEAIKNKLSEIHSATSELMPEVAGEKDFFTKRESEVLNLVAQGNLNKEVAYLLSISERTVQFHLKSIFEKLSVSSRTEAVTEALKRKLISL